MSYYVKKGNQYLRYKAMHWPSFCAGTICHDFYTCIGKPASLSTYDTVYEADNWLKCLAQSFIGYDGRTGILLLADQMDGYLEATVFKEKMEPFSVECQEGISFRVTPKLSEFIRNSNSGNKVRYLSLSIENDEWVEEARARAEEEETSEESYEDDDE